VVSTDSWAVLIAGIVSPFNMAGLMNSPIPMLFDISLQTPRTSPACLSLIIRRLVCMNCKSNHKGYADRRCHALAGVSWTTPARNV